MTSEGVKMSPSVLHWSPVCGFHWDLRGHSAEEWSVAANITCVCLDRCWEEETVTSSGVSSCGVICVRSLLVELVTTGRASGNVTETRAVKKNLN